MATYTYGRFPLHLCQGEVDFRTATVKALLVTSAYTPDLDLHDYASSVTGEVSGTGYTTGGVVLSGVTLVYDATTNTTRIDAADANFGILTATDIAGIVVYVSTGTMTTSPLVAYHGIGSESPDNQSFVYVWHSDGIATIAAA